MTESKIHRLFEFNSTIATMDVVRGPYYSLNYRFLSITGQWPYLSLPQKLIRGTITFLSFLSLIVPMCLGIYEARNDMDILIECIAPLLIVFLGLIMFINLVIMYGEFAILLEKIEKDWLTWSTEPEIEILKKYAEKGRKFRTTYAGSLGVILFCWLALPRWPTFLDLVKPLNESRPQTSVYYADFGIDSEKYYNTIYIHNYYTTSLAVFMFMNADMMFMACAQHTCGIFAAMGSKIMDLFKHHSLTHGENFQRKVDSEIIFCAKQHEELIIFLENIHNCFSSSFFVAVATNMLTMSFTGVQMVMNLDHPAVALRFGFSTLGQLAHLFSITIPCQQMIDHSMNLSDSVYESDWYLLPIQSQKLLLMIMRRSTKPFLFIVGRMYTYSMQNFAMVVKSSISYFTVLTSLQ